MPNASHTARVFRFSVYEVDLEAGELHKNGLKIRLQEQPFQVLAMLLERRGEIVTREEICRKLWPDGTFVEFDRSLNIAVNKIRDALGDSAGNPRFVETLPRRGYRFIAPVNPVTLDPSVPVSQAASRLRPRAKLAWAAGFTALALGVLATWRLARDVTPTAIIQKPAPLTSYEGREFSPSFSPDGNQVAFVWDGNGARNFDIYVTMVGASTQPLRLTDDPSGDYTPAWSPDGREIAFLRAMPERRLGLYVVSAIGGSDRKLAEVHAPLLSFEMELKPVLSWSPDGQWLMVADRESEEAPFHISLVSRNTGEKRRLTPDTFNVAGDLDSAFSPDGRFLAFKRERFGGLHLAGIGREFLQVGPSRLLTTQSEWVSGPVWTPDGREVIFSAGSKFRRSLWRIAASGPGAVERLAYAGEDGIDPAISSDGTRLAYTRVRRDPNLWRISTRRGGAAAAQGDGIHSRGSEPGLLARRAAHRLRVRHPRSCGDRRV